MIVVLDSNAIINDYWLVGRAPRRLLQQARVGQIGLVVPEVVILEVVKHFGEDLDTAVSRRAKADRLMRRLLRGYEVAASVDVLAEVDEYERHLRGALDEDGAQVVWPRAPHEDVAARAVTRGKPFKAGGAGYQDALIWEVVREQAGHDDVALISNNSADFGGDENGGLYATLEEELGRDGLVDRIGRYPTIVAFNIVHLAHAGVYEAELNERINVGYDETLREAVTELVESAGHRELIGVGSIADAANTTITMARIDDLELLAVEEGVPGRFYATLEARGEASLEFPMLQAEAWEMYEDRELDDFELYDDYLGTATMTVKFELTADADYDPDAGELSNYEISWARIS